jgi:hypothetical protein
MELLDKKVYFNKKIFSSKKISPQREGKPVGGGVLEMVVDG